MSRRLPLRWRRVESSWTGGSASWDLRRGADTEEIATVGTDRDGRFYWYARLKGVLKNTAGEGIYFDTLEAAKADAVMWVKAREDVKS